MINTITENFAFQAKSSDFWRFLVNVLRLMKLDTTQLLTWLIFFENYDVCWQEGDWCVDRRNCNALFRKESLHFVFRTCNKIRLLLHVVWTKVKQFSFAQSWNVVVLYIVLPGVWVMQRSAKSQLRRCPIWRLNCFTLFSIVRWYPRGSYTRINLSPA